MIISYGQALKFGWAIGWRVAFGFFVTVAPSIFVALLVGGITTRIGGRAQVLLWLVSLTFGLVVLPNAVQEAVLSSYSDFSVRVVRPARRAEALNYFEALQVLALTIIIYLGLGWLYSLLHLRVSFGIDYIAFRVFVVFPAIAAAVASAIPRVP